MTARESRPGGYAETAPKSTTTTAVDTNDSTAESAVRACKSKAPQDLLSQLRRRREAALRLPPLQHSGRRDPDQGMRWWR